MIDKIRKELRLTMLLGCLYIVLVILVGGYIASNNISKTITDTTFFRYVTYATIATLASIFIINPLIQLLYLRLHDGNKEIESRYFISDKELLDDYNRATGDGRLRTSVEFSYYKSWDRTCIIPNKDIVWAYKRRLTKNVVRVDSNRVKKERISRRVRYSLVIKTNDKKTYEVQFHTEDAVDYALSFYRHVPSIVVGYSDDYAKLYRYHFKQFLELKHIPNINKHQ